MSASPEHVRIAAVGDVRCTKANADNLRPMFAQISEQADVLLLCGDLTDNGLPEEAHLLLRALAPAMKIPVLAVFGKHDYESGLQNDIKKIFQAGGLPILDGDSREIHDIGFVGVKGFGGGFGQRMLQPWGETEIKTFVKCAVDETVKLESALARLRVPQRVAFMHYSPSASTAEGEPTEIFPFLGSSRLEEPLNRFNVNLVFHGHAHYGKAEGRTEHGAPIYNVAMPLLKRVHPDHPPFRIVHLPKKKTGAATAAPV